MRSFDRPILSVLLVATALLARTPGAHAIAQVPGPIEIGPSWGRIDPQGGLDALYTTIVNHGVLADRLSGGSCPGYGNVSLTGLDPATQGDAAQEKGLLLAPGATATLAPNGPHIALGDDHHKAAQGALISCTLSFVHSGQRLVVFRIGDPDPAVQEP
jgi:copper(I)-binding protein